MAGRIKHMERSRRSHRNNNQSIYRSFETRAWGREDAKQTRIGLFESFKKLFRKQDK